MTVSRIYPVLYKEKIMLRNLKVGAVMLVIALVVFKLGNTTPQTTQYQIVHRGHRVAMEIHQNLRQHQAPGIILVTTILLCQLGLVHMVAKMREEDQSFYSVQ